MKKRLFCTFIATVISGSSFANEVAVEDSQFSPPLNKYGKTIYPFTPYSKDEVIGRTKAIAETKKPVISFKEMMNQNLSERTILTAVRKGFQPWSGSFWPLNRGGVAQPFVENEKARFRKNISWKKNHRKLKKRIKKLQKNWDKYSTEDLNTLAPSEKYDILVGDYNFTFTKKLQKYMEDWGQGKENSYLTSIDKVGQDTWSLAQSYSGSWVNGEGVTFQSPEEAYPLARINRGGITDVIADYLIKQDSTLSRGKALSQAQPIALSEQYNYVIADVTKNIKTWEGICHGWATSAGIIPRPRKVVSFRLHNGQNLNFFPDDLKGLISLAWANNTEVQSLRYFDNYAKKFKGGVFVQGNRCNDPKPPKDPWGRFYDDLKDFQSGELKPACVGVHPAVWHLSLVNILGVQGRSFIVERQTTEKIDNHPLNGYKMTYFNPTTGEYNENIRANVVAADATDQFKNFRHSDTAFIVGVRLEMFYMNNTRPNRDVRNSEENDEIATKQMIYDLELDKNMNVVGGQWRAVEAGKVKFLGKKERTQPDFFWVVSKDWKSFFNSGLNLSKWDGKSLPPADYKAAAIKYSENKYSPTAVSGIPERCLVERKKSSDFSNKIPKNIKVNCTHTYDKPSPLFEVVDTLVELAK